jgi:3-oxoacyl-[acyl-carrier-protein] synthase-3
MGAKIAAESKLPEEVMVEKMCICEKRACPLDADHVMDMCAKAAERALADASSTQGISTQGCTTARKKGLRSVELRIDTDEAFVMESYALCTDALLAIRQAKLQLIADAPDTALLVAANCEENLVDYGNPDSLFMSNFGNGVCTAILEVGPKDFRNHATVRESAAITDGSFSEDVVIPGGGSRNSTSCATVEVGLHALDVADSDGIK